jgi:SAM-dependent methyltransferase
MSFYTRFASCYEAVFPFREEVYRFLKEHSGSERCAVLDAGCGPGHYCGRFVRDGYRATGIDLDGEMIASARKTYPGAAFRCLDLRRMNILGTGFRCIYSIGNVMAHLPSGDLPAFLERLHGMLPPDGVWIMQVVNWDRYLTMQDHDFPEKQVETAGGPLAFRRRYTAIRPESAIFSFSLHRGAETLFEERMTLYPVTTAGYLSLHEAAGFRRKGCFAGFTGEPFRSEGDAGPVMVFAK